MESRLVPGTLVTFEVNIGNTDSMKAIQSARLIIGIHRRGLTEPLKVELNGTPVALESGDASEFTEFFAPLDAEVPASLLEPGNTIKVATQPETTITSVQLITYRSMAGEPKERSSTSNGSTEVPHLFGAKLLLNRISKVNPTAKQLEEFNKLSRKLTIEVTELRARVGITKELIHQRNKAYKEVLKTDLKGDAFWLQLQKATGIADEQREAFRVTKEKTTEFKKNVMALLTDEQRKDLPKANAKSKE